MRRYLEYIPVEEEFLPHLHPGITPISEVNIGSVDAVFKLEYLHPSGSFKDRGTYVTIAKLKEEGIHEVVLDSSGNAGLSMALYALFSGIKVHIFLSYNTKPEKVSLLMRLNARVHFVEGDRMEVHKRAVEFSEREGVTYVSHWLNPYFLEGTKTVAYEVYEQIGVPEYVIVPVGSGTLFIGIWKGFRELVEMGETNIMPKMVAVQSSGYESLCERSPIKNFLADGIAIPEPPRKDEMVKILRETNGTCVSITEGETLAALSWLKRNGFIVEPTSATALAGLWKLMEDDLIEKGARVLIPLTGSGLKLTEGI
ncbi:threonine synthase [Pyrococcus sp. ST04]|nr:threonine synthase [Pyrococcus sp. ST04]